MIALVIATTGFAQEADTVKSRFMPTGVRVGLDAIAIIKSQVQDDFNGYELNADIDFYRYFLTVDVGRWERDFIGETDSYSNEGNYMRVGADINFLKKDVEKNMFFFGARYGFGKFSDRLSINLNDPIWGTRTETYSNDDVKAKWIELTTGLRVKMYKFFWMGYTARYKFGLSTKGDSGLLPSDVPGYGRTDKDSTWGFNYQLFFRLPIPQKK